MQVPLQSLLSQVSHDDRYMCPSAEIQWGSRKNTGGDGGPSFILKDHRTLGPPSAAESPGQKLRPCPRAKHQSAAPLHPASSNLSANTCTIKVTPLIHT